MAAFSGSSLARDAESPAIPRATLLAAFLVIAGFALAFQGARGIWRPDEGRYVGVAMQMLRSGDWVIPRFNDETEHFAKPPLTYWAIAASIALFGKNEFAARLPNTIAFLLNVAVVFAIGRILWGERAWRSALAYATFGLTFLAANVVTTDTILALFEALALLGFTAHRFGSARAARPGRLLMYSAFGLAFLTKGPPALLPLLGILAFTGWTDGLAGLRALWSWIGAAAFLAIGGTWFSVVVAREPELVDYFLRREVAGRLVSDGHGHYEAWYGAIEAYVPTLLFGTLPWTWLLLRRTVEFVGRLADRNRPAERLLVLLLGCAMLVLSLAKSRLPLYVLPLFTPLALVVGAAPAGELRRRPLAIALGIWLAVLTAAKAISGEIASARDGRALAQTLGAQAPFPLQHVVFVEASPHYGLSLYLDCEVEEIVLGHDAGAPMRFSGPLLGLQAELDKARPARVFVVPAAFAARFVETARDGGVAMQRFGGVVLGGRFDLAFFSGEREH